MSINYSLVHPDLQRAVQHFPRFTFSRGNLWFFRLMDKMPLLGKTPPDVSIERIVIPRADQSSLRLRVYRPTAQNASAPAMLWLHGGGYIIGRPEQDESQCLQYAREVGLVIVSVDYRRAPEHPFPAALDDGYTALQWLAANAADLGVDVNRLAIGGDSAGGGLAAALAQLACDRHEIIPIFQLLVYPMLDDRTVLRADLAGRVFLMWDQASNRFGWESYLGQPGGAESVAPYAVPARRADVSNLPPAWIGVGSLDMFHDEDVAYAQCLQASGVECELTIVPGAFHGFDFVGPQVNVVQNFRQSQIAALRKYLFGGLS